MDMKLSLKKSAATLGLTAAALGGALTLPARAQDAPRIFVNGQPLRTRVAPIVEDGRTLVPLRAIFERLGATVSFDPVDQRIVARRAGTVVRLRLDSTEASVNESNITLDVPATSYYGSTLVPLRFVSEALGAEVDYDFNRNEVDVDDARIDNPGPDRHFPNDRPDWRDRNRHW
jgi:hypothetical protein